MPAASVGEPDQWCPSARPDHPDAVVFGVRTGASGSARIGYLSEPVPVTDELLALAEPVSPLEVFRFGAPCAKSGCAHFAGESCSLISRIVERVPVAVSIAPPCVLRPKCRWWHQEGMSACRRCPLVVTSESGSHAELAGAAMPVVPDRLLDEEPVETVDGAT